MTVPHPDRSTHHSNFRFLFGFSPIHRLGLRRRPYYLFALGNYGTLLEFSALKRRVILRTTIAWSPVYECLLILIWGE
jgi:hypothetical protein